MDTCLIITNSDLTSPEKKIWGDGSWISPDDREALEWFMFARIMGWNSRVLAMDAGAEDFRTQEIVKWVILACSPDQIAGDTLCRLLDIIHTSKSMLVVRPGPAEADWLTNLGVSYSGESITGGSLKRHPGSGDTHDHPSLTPAPPSRTIAPTKTLCPLLRIDHDIVTVKRHVGAGCVLALGFQPVAAMDALPGITPLLKELLTIHHPASIAWMDWRNTMALRMDDPGSSELVHNNTYADCNKLGRNEWKRLGEVLKKNSARLSIGYVNGWVDDGNPLRGTLEVNGRSVPRTLGAVYPSKDVVYRTANGRVCDYREEYEAIQQLRQENLVDVETHGFAHVFPNTQAWSSAATRHDSNDWFREFSAAAGEYIHAQGREQHPLAKAKAAMKGHWDAPPGVMIFPCEAFTLRIQEDALQLGWQMISSYYQAIRFDDRFCWTQLICSPYLDQFDPKWVASEFPFVGYFHDFDLARNGVRWFDECIEGWKTYGVKRIIGLKDLFVGLNCNLSVKESDGTVYLHCGNERDSMTDHRFPVQIKSGVEIISTYTSRGSCVCK